MRVYIGLHPDGRLVAFGGVFRLLFGMVGEVIIQPRIEKKGFGAIALVLIGFATGYIANQLLILAAFAVGDLLEWWFG